MEGKWWVNFTQLFHFQISLWTIVKLLYSPNLFNFGKQDKLT